MKDKLAVVLSDEERGKEEMRKALDRLVELAMQDYEKACKQRKFLYALDAPEELLHEFKLKERYLLKHALTIAQMRGQR